MRLKISVEYLNNIFIFFLPLLIILSQWLSIASINISWILYIIIFIKVARKFNVIKKNNRLMVFSAITILTPFFSYLFGISDSFNGNLFFSIATGLSVMLYVYYMHSTQFEWFLRGLALSCLVFSIWGIYETVTGNYILFSNNLLITRRNMFGAYYPGVAFANTNDLSQYLSFLFPFCFYLSRKSKTMMLFFWIITFYVTFHSESRLAMICVLVESLVLLFLITGFGKKYRTQKIIIIVLILMVFGYFVEMEYGLISSTFTNFIDININAAYFVARESIYKTLIDLAVTLPFGGFGSAYSIQSLTPHNLFLYILVDYGWFVCIAFVLFLLGIGRRVFIKARTNGDVFNWVCFISLCVFPILSCVSSTNEQRKIIWIILGILIRQAFMSKDESMILLHKQEEVDNYDSSDSLF